MSKFFYNIADKNDIPYFKEKEKCTAASKTTTLQPGKKNAHVILFTHGRA